MLPPSFRPYDHDHVIAGQGTATLELIDEVHELDAIWLPVGGGGLAGGAILAADGEGGSLGPNRSLPVDAAASLAAGERQPQMPPVTVADGLRAGLGVRNFELLSRYALPIHLVSEAEIIEAQKLLMSCLKLVVEPSSAVPVAALLKARPGGRVGVVLSGGNAAL